MSRQYIRDKHFNVIGSIDTLPDGKQRAYDKYSNVVGAYDCRADRTYDRHFNSIGGGNQLVGLIWQSVSK